MKYVYEGPGPQEYDDDGTLRIVRPGDIFAEEPDWGPFRAIEDEGLEAAGKPAAPPAIQSPAPAASSPPAAAAAAPATQTGA